MEASNVTFYVELPNAAYPSPIYVPRSATFSQLQDILTHAFSSLRGQSFAISYQDDEGDLIRVHTDPEVREAIRLASGKQLSMLRVSHVQPTSAAPRASPAAAATATATAPAPATLGIQIELPSLGMLRMDARQDEPISELKRRISAQTGLPFEMLDLSFAAPEPLPTEQAPSRCPRANRRGAPVVHAAYCDSCNATIRGIRYKCVNCPDYDLCERCEPRSELVHHASHAFLKLRRPIAHGSHAVLPLLYEQQQEQAPVAPTAAPVAAAAADTKAQDELAARVARLEQLLEQQMTLAQQNAAPAQQRAEERARKEEAHARRKQEAMARKHEALARKLALIEQRRAAAAAARQAATAVPAQASVAPSAPVETPTPTPAPVAAAPATDAAEPRTDFQLKLDALANMGFGERTQNAILLCRNGGDLQLTIEQLLLQ